MFFSIDNSFPAKLFACRKKEHDFAQPAARAKFGLHLNDPAFFNQTTLMFTTLIKLRTESNVVAPALPRTQYRINSIDLLRGLVMIIMALDHVRDFTHREAMIDDPLNFATTTPLLFFTRWITHFCAPVFVFLAGSSIFLQGLRKTKKELSLFIIKRGI